MSDMDLASRVKAEPGGVAEFARRFGISLKSAYRYLNRERVPPKNFVLALKAEYPDVSADYFYDSPEGHQ